MADNAFARGLLEKYGWSEGKGLGKHENGIAQALKPKLKFDTAGVGHKIDLTSQWWSKAFNDAARSIKVCVSDGEPTIAKEPKKEKEKKTSPRDSYEGFIKAGVQDGSMWLQACPEFEAVDCDVEDSELPERIPDEQLFKACGGLTAHKAARHGHKMSGKLKRVQQQEEALMCGSGSAEAELVSGKTTASTDSSQTTPPGRKSKRKKHLIVLQQAPEESSGQKSRRKKKRKQKSDDGE